MKNQYFGDINDFRKYALLRKLSKSGFKTHIIWMLTPDDKTTDGSKTIPAKCAVADDWLYYGLQDLLATQKRGVKAIEKSSLLPDVTFYSKKLTDDKVERAAWFTSACKTAKGSDLVFLDPDNGLEVPSTPKGRKNSSKYLYWDEFDTLWKSGFSIMVYQHFPRKTRDEFLNDLTLKMMEHTSNGHIETVETPNVAFLFALQEHHVAMAQHAFRYATATDQLKMMWAPYVKEV